MSRMFVVVKAEIDTKYKGGITMENKKYRLTEESQIMDGRTEVFRIEAVSNFGDVRVGDLGGFIESEDDLTNDLGDDSWVYDEAVAYGYDYNNNRPFQAQGVSDNAKITGNSIVKNSIVSEGAVINNSRVEESLVKDSKVVDSNVLNGSNVLGCQDVEKVNLDETSFINTGIVHGSSFKKSVVQSSDVRNTEMEDSMFVLSKSDDSIVMNSDVLSSTMSEGSEIYDVANLKDSDIVSTSLNDMEEVVGSVFRKSHAQESTVMDSIVDHSNLNNASIYESSKIDHSDVSLSSVSGHSKVKNSLLRSGEERSLQNGGVQITEVRRRSEIEDSKVYGSVIDGASCRNSYIEDSFKLSEHVENYDSRIGLQLNDEDLAGLEDNGLNL